jgi:SSS family solute:Na+ symporter
MLETIDWIIIAAYGAILITIAQWVSREKSGHTKNAEDYFLASHTLPWWAIGTSLIAANISAEQIIGMSGSGYAMGLAIASYEWMAAITLIIVAKYFLPIFISTKIYTMPQFLEYRYDHRVKITMALFWLGVYIFVNLTSVLWLGALALNTVTGIQPTTGLIALGLFALSYSLYGGLKAVALTDIIQVTLLVMGGLLIVDTLLNQLSEQAGILKGFEILVEKAPEHFDMILSADNPHYMSLPGISVLVGGLWVMNVSYWGFNQYIIQRALGAKNTQEAQKGLILAAALKVLMPLIVVIPGIAMFALDTTLTTPDEAYPTAMTLLPSGIKGLVFAALLAAIVSSLASMTNSIATIFTMDVAPSLFKNTADSSNVNLGRLVSLAAMLVAMIFAQPLLGKFDQAFQYIQEFTGFFTPGICAIFILGFFYKKTTPTAALIAAIGSAALSILFKMVLPDIAFMDRVGITFLCCLGLAIGISQFTKLSHDRSFDMHAVDTETTTAFNLSALIITLIVSALYASWW